jgi:type II secretion system protein N
VSRRSLLLALLAGIGILALFPSLVMLLIPGEKIESAISRVVEREGYVYRSGGLRKSFPLTLRLSASTISDLRGPLLNIEAASARLELLPLLAGKIVLECRARIGKGECKAEYQPRTGELDLHFTGVRLEDVPLFRTAGYGDLRGVLDVDGSFSGRGFAGRGEIRITVQDADFRGVRIGAALLPDATYKIIRGVYRSTGGKGTLDSLAFQGDGIYLRMQGRISGSHPGAASSLDLSLDLMPKPGFIERQKFVFLALAPYKTSPGVYRIPIGGTLEKPVIR